jgi:hypothetical protein
VPAISDGKKSFSSESERGPCFVAAHRWQAIRLPAQSPNKGHPAAMNIAVGDKVKQAISDSKAANMSEVDTRKAIVIALQEQAEAYIDSRWPGYLNSHSIFKVK